MNWDQAFMAINGLVVPAWLLLVFLPRHGLTRKLVHSALYPAIMGGIYLATLVAAIFFGQSAEGVGFSSLAAVALLFDHPNGVIVGWTHYLVFDLFVGAWISRDAQRRKIPHLIVIPGLISAFLFGPIGLLYYMLLRLFRDGTISLDES